MRRRDFLRSATAGVAAGSLLAGGSVPVLAERRDQIGGRTISNLAFDSTSSLLDAEKTPLRDESLVAVWAMETARSEDSDEAGDAVDYGSLSMPLVAVDPPVVGFGAMLVTDDDDFSFANEEFRLNVWDEYVDGDRVIWDGGHDQFFDLSQFTEFRSFAEDNGYTVEATSSLADDLEDADGVVITSPSQLLTDAETSALTSFAENGGAVFLHDQADHRDFDETENLNEIAAALDASFRFNDDQVFDDENNGGPPFVVVTDRFNDDGFSPLVEDTQGIASGPQFEVGNSYTGTVVGIDDADSFQIDIDGTTETVRLLGVDNPEIPENVEFENPHEWEGLADKQDAAAEHDGEYPYLSSWGVRSAEFAESRLAGEEVTISFDENEGVSDPFGRLLAYVELSDGSMLNRQLVSQGFGRVFGSTLSRHDEFLQRELQAREEGRGLWANSDPESSSPFRNQSVEKLFFPNPAQVRFRTGFNEDRTPVFGEASASPGEAPLVGIDRENRVAMIGAPLFDTSYEREMGFDVSTAQFGNFTFLTNLIMALTDREDGFVAIDGGHGQFSSDWSVSSEDGSFYQRHLEGLDVGFEQVNNLTGDLLEQARALIVSTPLESHSSDARDAIVNFRDDGGAVILFGSGAAPSETRSNLDTVATALGTDMRIDVTSVTDPESNLVGSEDLVVTSNFDRRFTLFSPHGAGPPGLTTTTTTAATTTTETTTSSEPRSMPGMGVLGGAASLAAGLYGLRRLRDGGSDEDD